MQTFSTSAVDFTRAFKTVKQRKEKTTRDLNEIPVIAYPPSDSDDMTEWLNATIAVVERKLRACRVESRHAIFSAELALLRKVQSAYNS